MDAISPRQITPEVRKSGRLHKPLFVQFVKAVDYDLIVQCGVDAALVLPLLQDHAYRAWHDKSATRLLGQIRFRASYEDLEPLSEIFGRERYAEALLALQRHDILIVDGDDMIRMADMFGQDPIKVELKDKPAGKRHLYLFRTGDGLSKIGITKDIKRREKELYPALFVTSVVIGDALEQEKRLHAKYGEYRRGGEWFKIPEEMIDSLIAEIQELAV